jgi:3-oxoacyl-[acyl-carrier protein] reductase
MDLELHDRVALVTGGSKGIGASIVRGLAREGAHVCFCARPSEQLIALADEIRKEGGICEPIAVDVFDANAINSTVKECVRRMGGLDILVNNVGGALRFGNFDELEDEDWIRAFEFNVMSVVRFTRAALPYLKASKLKRIINISSISALQPGQYNPHYTTTKAAVVNLGKYLSNILAREKILVNTVCPGPVHSDSWEKCVKSVAQIKGISEKAVKTNFDLEQTKKIPLGKIGQGEDIAAVVAFIASPKSHWTTGACININGGKLSTAI